MFFHPSNANTTPILSLINFSSLKIFKFSVSFVNIRLDKACLFGKIRCGFKNSKNSKVVGWSTYWNWKSFATDIFNKRRSNFGISFLVRVQIRLFVIVFFLKLELRVNDDVDENDLNDFIESISTN